MAPRGDSNPNGDNRLSCCGVLCKASESTNCQVTVEVAACQALMAAPIFLPVPAQKLEALSWRGLCRR